MEYIPDALNAHFINNVPQIMSPLNISDNQNILGRCETCHPLIQANLIFQLSHVRILLQLSALSKVVLVEQMVSF